MLPFSCLHYCYALCLGSLSHEVRHCVMNEWKYKSYHGRKHGLKSGGRIMASARNVAPRKVGRGEGMSPPDRRRGLACSSDFGLPGELLGKQSSPKLEFHCPGRRRTTVQNLTPLALSSTDWLTDWLTECLYYDIWQTADEITMNDINTVYR